MKKNQRSSESRMNSSGWPPAVRALEVANSEVLDGVLLERVSLENVNWNMGVRKMTDSGGLSWEAQEVLQKIKWTGL